MYGVSENYKAAMKAEIQQFKMSGTVGDVRFFDENILSGSFSITDQCSGSDLVSIGQVYIGELNATFLGINIGRYSWKGKEITPVFSQMLPDGTYEDVPLGVFTIDQADWTSSGVVVKAYDHMAKFDKPFPKTLSNGTAFEIATIICEECGVGLGTTEEEFLLLPNGEDILSEYEENDVETYRDLISWLSQTLCCFATMDRYGNLVFRTYTQDAVDIIDDMHRFKGASFSDFETRYTGLSCVNIGEKTTSYYSLETDDALTYNLGSNPFLQYGLEETRNAMREAVLYALQGIRYVPFKASAIGNPAYDLGDVLIFTGGIADPDKKYCITKYCFKYNGNYEMEGVGQNPALASAKSKSDKNLVGLMNEVAGQGMKYYVLRNVRDINIYDGDDKQAFVSRFAVAKESHVRINIEILLTLTATITGEEEETDPDIVCGVRYYLDGREVTDRHPVETWREGRHILTLQYDVDGAEAAIHSFAVWLSCRGGSLKIKRQDFYEVVSGDGLAAQATWDGTITVYDEYSSSMLTDLVGDVSDTLSLVFPDKAKRMSSESFSAFDLGCIIGGFTEALGSVVPGIMFNTANASLMTLSGIDASGEYFTGTGTIITQTVSVTGIKKIVMEIESGNVLIAFSFDEGDKWYGYSQGAFVEMASGGVTAEILGSIPESAWETMLTGTIRIRATMTQARLREIFVYTEE